MNKAAVLSLGVAVGIVAGNFPQLITKVAAEPSRQAWYAGAKSTRKTLIDNERVQVVDYTVAPGDDKPGMHTHAYPHVDVILQGGAVVVNNPDGSTATLKVEAGTVFYRDGNVTHEPVNSGNSPVRLIEIHVK
jgi:mannose-6-phosphate isomerase-like protein (cupin superfamily)